VVGAFGCPSPLEGAREIDCCGVFESGFGVEDGVLVVGDSNACLGDPVGFEGGHESGDEEEVGDIGACEFDGFEMACGGELRGESIGGGGRTSTGWVVSFSLGFFVLDCGVAVSILPPCGLGDGIASDIDSSFDCLLVSRSSLITRPKL
jgi:hypothetical protein